MLRSWRLLLALALAATACVEAGPATWTTTVDTLAGGVVRVVNIPPAGAIEPTWVIEPEVRIGAIDAEGPTSFGQIRGIAVLDDGGVAVLDAQARELRIFGPDGTHRRSLGRQGSGPGELEAPFGLMRGPDGRLWVPDSRLRRMTVYHPVTGFVASYEFPLYRWGFIFQGAMTHDGRILKPSLTLRPERLDILRVYGPEMTLLDSLPMPALPAVDDDDPPSAFVFGSRESGAWGMMGVPYFPSRSQRLDPAGVVWSTGYGDPSYRIARWEPGGDTTLILETRRPPVPVTAAERDSAIDRIRDALRDRGGADQDWSKIPDVKPAVAGMYVADDGRLWVRAASPDPRFTYDVYDRDGRYAGTAITDLAVYTAIAPIIEGDHFWAVVTDELDVQYVVRARIHREPTGGAERRQE